MKKVYIRTTAYNAEDTLERAVNSVLNQTHSDFVYYLCDNGSTDKTKEIVEKYAKLDKRIVPFYNKINHDYTGNEEILNIVYNIDDEDYFCLLDADDECYPSFFEEMLKFMEEYKLDIGICGSDWFNVKENNRYLGKRTSDNIYVSSTKDDYSNFFTYYYQFIRTLWGKLFTGKSARNFIGDITKVKNYPLAYGGDTFTMFRCLEAADRVGIYPKSLYKYYYNPKSSSYKFNEGRISSDRVLFECAINFLNSKYGYVTEVNKNFILYVYMNALVDTCSTLFNSKMPDEEKLDYLLDILNHEYTKKLSVINYALLGLDESNYLYNLTNLTANWLLSLNEYHQKSRDVLSALLDYIFSETHLNLTKDEVDYIIKYKYVLMKPLIIERNLNSALLKLNKVSKKNKKLPREQAALKIKLSYYAGNRRAEILKLCSDFATQFPIYKVNIENIIMKILSEIKLLSNIKLISSEIFYAYEKIIIPLIGNDMESAFSAIIEIEENGYINDTYSEEFFKIAQNVAAFLENAAGFIYYKKMAILLFIDKKEFDKARLELSDFDILMPHDKDFKTFREKLS